MKIDVVGVGEGIKRTWNRTRGKVGYLMNRRLERRLTAVGQIFLEMTISINQRLESRSEITI